MSSLNAPEEVEPAERLVELHPWPTWYVSPEQEEKQMLLQLELPELLLVKAKLQFVGIMAGMIGYLSVNLNENDLLDEHLLPGLDTTGVPQIYLV